MTIIGKGDRALHFHHENGRVGDLTILTGMDGASWGYSLNTANFPTYGGEVIQILGCYIEDLQLNGTLRNYSEMEVFYQYFFNYFNAVAAQGVRDERPMYVTYAHRGWTFAIIPTDVPGYRKGREVVAPEWRLTAHVVDHAGDVESLKDLIIDEATMKTRLDLKKPDEFTENFGLQGVIRFVDENPFSDPKADPTDFSSSKEADEKLVDFYSKLLPAYMEGDYDAIVGDTASRPLFRADTSADRNEDKDEPLPFDKPGSERFK